MIKNSLRYGDTLQSIFWAVGIAVLPNIAFSAGALWLGIDRPLINLDYLFSALLLSYGYVVTGSILGFLFLSSDVLVLISQILPFPNFADVFYLAKFALFASTLHAIIFASVVIVVAVKLYVLVAVGRKLSSKLMATVLCAALATHFAGEYLTDGDDGVNNYRTTHKFMVATQLGALLQMRSSGFLDNFDSTVAPELTPALSATKPWFANFGNGHPAPRAMLIVNESWGVPVNPEVQEALLKPIKHQGKKFYNTGILHIDGFTVDAELRELCALKASHLVLANVKLGFESCLPALLTKHGYETLSLHGATRLMYERHQWYGRVGIQKSVFFEDKLWPRRCRSFPGACDRDMRDEIAEFFTRTGDRFLYWLTLNTHAPYDLRDLTAANHDQFDCAAHKINVPTETCRNLKLQYQFFQDLAEVLDRKELQGVEVIVVGDHPPVILNQDEKKEYFKLGQVPWIHFGVMEH